ncbi:hypothetical protein GQR58_008215 [Nymphon striatum]|nr:hypothetical protein GQR58_008215 [Nymphon striatum]
MAEAYPGPFCQDANITKDSLDNKQILKPIKELLNGHVIELNYYLIKQNRNSNDLFNIITQLAPRIKCTKVQSLKSKITRLCDKKKKLARKKKVAGMKNVEDLTSKVFVEPFQKVESPSNQHNDICSIETANAIENVCVTDHFSNHCTSSVGVQTSFDDIDCDNLSKKTNLLQYINSKKLKKLNSINNRIGHYSTRNINKRDKTAKKNLHCLRQSQRLNFKKETIIKSAEKKISDDKLMIETLLNDNKLMKEKITVLSKSVVAISKTNDIEKSKNLSLQKVNSYLRNKTRTLPKNLKQSRNSVISVGDLTRCCTCRCSQTAPYMPDPTPGQDVMDTIIIKQEMQDPPIGHESPGDLPPGYSYRWSALDMPDPTPSPAIMDTVIIKQEMQDPPIGNESPGDLLPDYSYRWSHCVSDMPDATPSPDVMDTIIIKQEMQDPLIGNESPGDLPPDYSYRWSHCVSDTNASRARSKMPVLPRRRLMDNAIPTIFPNCPSYMSHENMLPRSKNATSENRVKESNNQLTNSISQMFEADVIQNIDEILRKLEKATSVPVRLLGCIAITSNLDVTITVNEELVDTKLFNGVLLGVDMKANSFSAVLNLMACAKSEIQKLDNNYDQHIHRKSLQFIEEYASVCDYEVRSKVKFFAEQINLVNKPKAARRYAPETLIMCYLLYCASPSGYKELRKQNFLTIPSERTLQTITDKVGNISEFSYLNARVSKLKHYEKNVILIIDEIYSAKRTEYSAAKGQIFGVTDDGEVAQTLLGFMISSIAGPYRDMVSLFPMKKINVKKLTTCCFEVLKLLDKIGLNVVAISVDNHPVNRSFFVKELCGGFLKPSIKNSINEDYDFVMERNNNKVLRSAGVDTTDNVTLHYVNLDVPLLFCLDSINFTVITKKLLLDLTR